MRRGNWRAPLERLAHLLGRSGGRSFCLTNICASWIPGWSGFIPAAAAKTKNWPLEHLADVGRRLLALMKPGACFSSVAKQTKRRTTSSPRFARTECALARNLPLTELAAALQSCDLSSATTAASRIWPPRPAADAAYFLARPIRQFGRQPNPAGARIRVRANLDDVRDLKSRVVVRERSITS